jgi:RNA polymerase sigma-70 factor (ECF subfamily)
LGSTERPNTQNRPARGFATTHWSVVLAAGGSDAAGAREALSGLCQTYWYPLYAYVRRKGHSPQDAEDLTQEFFLRLLEHDWVARADQGKGRFRSFLLTVLNRFLADEWDKVSSKKRGGHLRRVPLSMEDAEKRFSREPVDAGTPEQEFEKQWALTVLERVLARLRDEYARRGQAALFDALKPSLAGSRQTQPYDRLGAELGMTEGNVKVAVFRLRRRYRQRLTEEIAHTVASPDEVESELRHLFRVLARR